MSLKYVTKKLKDQSLEEEELYCEQESQVEDSGTESDDETETEQGDDIDSEVGDCNLDSGISLNLRSSSDKASGGRSRQLPSLAKPSVEQQQTRRGTEAPPSSAICAFSPGTKFFLLDDNDNHSSEEELEDIIGNSGKRKVYVSPGEGGTGVSSSSSCGPAKPVGVAVVRSSSCNPEKRKWSEVNGGAEVEGKMRGTSQCVFRASSGSSGDEEVSGLMEGAGPGQYTPVQFCTSPPLDVYKPRQSQSPPPKLFHMSMNGHASSLIAHDTLEVREGGLRGAFRPRPRVLRPGGGAWLGGVRYEQQPARPGSRSDVLLNFGDGSESGEEQGGADGEAGRDHRSTPSPNKRHRSTPKPQNIQRPCLDFEKMQQIKTRVVTSWRQGTELSLFVW